MAPHIEFEGQMVKPEEGQSSKLQITSSRPISPGTEVVIHEQKIGFLRKQVLTRTTVRILNKDQVQIKKIRLLESTITNAGHVDTFGTAVQHYDFIDGKAVPVEIKVYTRGEVWEHDRGTNKIKGVAWVNDDHERVVPKIISPKRAFYAGDSDPKAREAFEVHKKNRA
jgi:hypothetical protein